MSSKNITNIGLRKIYVGIDVHRKSYALSVVIDGE
jgi:hypothetical protein